MGVDISDLVSVVKNYGPLVLVVAFLLWQGWCRESRMAKRITRLEDDHKKVLLPLVSRCMKVITRNTHALQHLEQLVRGPIGLTGETGLVGPRGPRGFQGPPGDMEGSHDAT